jgi:hypothetical protein
VSGICGSARATIFDPSARSTQMRLSWNSPLTPSHHQKFDPEFHSLLARPLRKLSPRYPSREAHVVIRNAFA